MERLKAVAIIRAGVTHDFGEKGTHADLRSRLGDENPYEPMPGDEAGYLTDGGRFVDRWEASIIAGASGQAVAVARQLLSCDVMWDRRPSTRPDGQPAGGRGRLYGKPARKRLF